jgi:hypothetical protein
MDILAGIFRSLAASVREINAKYAKPNVEMTPVVKVSLLLLRIYLLLLVGLMVYKFIVAASHR